MATWMNIVFHFQTVKWVSDVLFSFIIFILFKYHLGFPLLQLQWVWLLAKLHAMFGTGFGIRVKGKLWKLHRMCILAWREQEWGTALYKSKITNWGRLSLLETTNMQMYRGCGWDGICKYIENRIDIHHCLLCFDDLCNGAGGLNFSPIILVSFILFANKIIT